MIGSQTLVSSNSRMRFLMALFVTPLVMVAGAVIMLAFWEFYYSFFSPGGIEDGRLEFLASFFSPLLVLHYMVGFLAVLLFGVSLHRLIAPAKLRYYLLSGFLVCSILNIKVIGFALAPVLGIPLVEAGIYPEYSIEIFLALIVSSWFPYGLEGIIGAALFVWILKNDPEESR